MEKHKIKNIKKSIYYEYIISNKYDFNFHLISIDSDDFNCIIPCTYQINYAQSNNSYNEKGHICFYNEKYNYTLDFNKKDYESFKIHMSHKEKDIKKRFTNYRNQLFYELINNNNEYIYMYYKNYYFKLYTNHKMSINEYYDMYLILMSISNEKISKNIELLKELYYFNDNGIYSICNDVDLISCNLTEYTKDIKLDENDYFIANDDDYLDYKSKQTKVDTISKDIISNVMNNNQNLDAFKFANLGSYNVFVNGYDEIIESDELSINEKNTLIEKMVSQKQNETYSNKDKINNEFYDYLIKYLKNNLNYQLWDVYHVREFINNDKFDVSINDNDLYKVFMDNIDNEEILNMKLVFDSIKSHELNIYPNKYILRLSLLNGLLNNLKIIFDEDYNLLELNK